MREMAYGRFDIMFVLVKSREFSRYKNVIFVVGNVLKQFINQPLRFGVMCDDNTESITIKSV